MKKAFNIILFVSFAFLFIYLLKQEYIIPDIQNYTLLALSFILLFFGFILQTFSWKVALKSHATSISRRDAIISQGQAIFAKYIPGKVWVILGRASYISKDKVEMKSNSFISLKEQIIYTWVGFLISAIPTIIFYKLQWISILMLLVIVGLSLFLFSVRLNLFILKLINRIFKSNLEIPIIRLRDTWPMIIAVSLLWISWTSGFYLFMMAFSSEITPVMMFAFPLSVCFGLLAIIAPGGIGVREGIIIGYLTLAALDLEISTTISFFNRLWFLSGEVFIFLFSLALKLKRKA